MSLRMFCFKKVIIHLQHCTLPHKISKNRKIHVASPTNPRPSPPKRGLARGRVGKLSSTRTPVNLRPTRLGRDPCSPDQWGGSDVSLNLEELWGAAFPSKIPKPQSSKGGISPLDVDPCPVIRKRSWFVINAYRMLTLLTYNVLNRDAHYIEELLGCGVALCNQSDWRQGWNTSMDAKKGWAGGITQASSENQHYLGSMLQFNIIYPSADMDPYIIIHISSHTLPYWYMICLYSSSISVAFLRFSGMTPSSCFSRKPFKPLCASTKSAEDSKVTSNW